MNNDIYAQTCIIQPPLLNPQVIPQTPWVNPSVGFPPPGSFFPAPPENNGRSVLEDLVWKPADDTTYAPSGPSLGEILADSLKRAKAADKDKAMLGDSGYERIAADLYQTPPENVDVLFQYFQPVGPLVWEPACGEGYISKRINELGYETWSSDLHDYGFGTPNMDFLATERTPHPSIRTIVTNPPYDELAEKFIRHALKLMEPVKGQVAMFLRNEFDCGKGRMDLFGKAPFHAKIVVTKRPRWIAGSTGSPRHNYSWFVWDWRHIKGPAATYYQHPSFAQPVRSSTSDSMDQHTA